MKFLHLADLHIGKYINAYQMIEDQEYALSQALEYARTHKPDAVLISGDIYDRSVPPPDAVRAFDRFLTSMSALGPVIAIVSGNHDSPERLSFASDIIKSSDIHIYGVFDGNMKCVPLRDEYGEVRLYLLPYIKPSDVRRYLADDSPTRVESYQDAVSAIIRDAGIDTSVRNILIAHQYFASEGLDPERSESEREIVGGVDRVDVAECGVAGLFDYAALGHLHGPQRVGAEHVRYAGSLLKYSFSECNHKKAVLLVEIKEKNDLTVTALPIVPLRDMRRISGALADLTGEKARAAAGNADYLHITLTDEEEIYDARGKLLTVYPNLMQLSFDNARTNADFDFGVDEEAWRAPPIAQFDEFYRIQNGVGLNDWQYKVIAGFLNPESDIAFEIETALETALETEDNANTHENAESLAAAPEGAT